MVEKNYPIYATQGGGTVRKMGGRFIFIEAPPNIPSLGIGDEMPSEWGITPINNAACQSLEEEFR